MKILCLESVDPYWNLALEETVLRHRKDDDYLLLWRNDRTVVVGRYQNTLEEIDSGYVRSHGIKVGPAGSPAEDAYIMTLAI